MMRGDYIIGFAAISMSVFLATFYSLIKNIPRILMYFISRSLDGSTISSAAIKHWNKISHKDRKVVIPCPDLLYSTLPLDFTDDRTAVIISGPPATYASWGIYDCNAKCCDILSHSGIPFRGIIVSCKANETDSEIRKKLEENDTTKVVRLPSIKGLLLHRMLIPRPVDYEKIRVAQQESVTSEVRCLSGVNGPHKGSGDSLWKMLYTPATFPSLTILVGTLAKLFMSSSWSDNGLSLTVMVCAMAVGGAFLGILAALIMMKLLRQPGFVAWTNMMRLRKVGQWNFNQVIGGAGGAGEGQVGVRTGMSWGEPFQHLIFFLHGALGLLPTEVQYGTCVSAATEGGTEGGVSRDVPLAYGDSFVIEVPSLDLDCAWWSITVYGDDLYLVPNEEEVFSVNSFQLEEIASKNDKPIRIVCSPTKPTTEEDAFWLPMPLAESATERTKSARFVLRAYLPNDGPLWPEAIASKSKLPIIKKTL